MIGPLLGPTVGGLIVHWLSWREIFFVNVPMGIVALLIIYRHMPDYRGRAARPLDVVGLVLFGSGTALLSWLLEIFGEHSIDVTSAGVLFLLSMSLLAAYAWHARQAAYPLLRLSLFAGAYVSSFGGRWLRHTSWHRRYAAPAPAALSTRPRHAAMGVGPADDAKPLPRRWA